MLDSPAARDAAVSNEPNDVAIISTDALVAAEPPVSAAAATIDAAAATIDLLPHATPLPQADGDADADAALALALEPYAGVRFSGMFRACVPALQALHNACFPIVYSDSFYEQLVAGDEYSTILALSEADGSVVGFATGRVESDAAASVVCRARRRSGYISTFGVAPSHRGRGLGSVLLKVCWRSRAQRAPFCISFRLGAGSRHPSFPPVSRFSLTRTSVQSSRCHICQCPPSCPTLSTEPVHIFRHLSLRRRVHARRQGRQCGGDRHVH